MIADILIVGAGFSGITIAERVASQLGKKVLLIDRRDHIGGNCYDYYNDDGILVHKYGPHYFRTNDHGVRDYLSQFTIWHHVQYKILAFVDGQYYNFPVNLDTFNNFFDLSLNSEQMTEKLKELSVKCEEIRNSRDVIVSRIGERLYESFYKNYTKKQWGVGPEELDPSVCARIPIRTNRDDRYLNDEFQAMPKDGYHKMFERMVDHPNIELQLNTEYKDIAGNCEVKSVVFTGPVDEFFDFRFGKLPYRSLRFEHETLDQQFYQPTSQVNYPNDHEYTRIVEIKHVTGQYHPKTTIVREYPVAEGDPYYPVPMPENEVLCQKYLDAEKEFENLFFTGRLARYRYLNMDQVVAQALELFESQIKNALND